MTKVTAIIIAAVIGLLAVSASADIIDISGTVEVKAEREDSGLGVPQQPTGPWSISTYWNSTGVDLFEDSGFWIVEEFRWAIEFDLDLIPDGATISSAQLGLSTDNNFSAGQISVGGYAGNGLGELSDIEAGSEVFSYSPPLYAFVWNDVTAFVNGLVGNGDQYAGFNLQQLPLDLDGPWSSSAYWDGMTGDTPAILQIEYVPEPASLALLGLGGWAMIRRRR